MVCIYCGDKTRVTNSRSSKKSHSTWRRRACESCKATVTSVEEYDLSQTHRVQSPDGSLKPFLRDLLFLDVYQSLSHRKSALADATALTDTIIQGCIASSHRGKINNSTITELTSSTLEKFDIAGATYYRSHHPSN